jgi:hypothetical protein
MVRKRDKVYVPQIVSGFYAFGMTPSSSSRFAEKVLLRQSVTDVRTPKAKLD